MFSNLNLPKIIGGVSKTLNIAKGIVPFYKEVKPIYTNVRRVISTFNSVKKESENEKINNLKQYIRPINNFKEVKSNEERGEFDLDTLTFFN